MRNPFGSETDAFRFLLLCIGAFAPVAAAAVLGPRWLALTVAGTVAAVVASRGLLLGIRRHRRLELTVKTAPPHVGAPDEHRVLVVANDTLDHEGLAGELGRLASAPGVRVRVLAPPLLTRRARWTGADGSARKEARARLEVLLRQIPGDLGATGEVSDSEPLQAIEDALTIFPADEIVVVTRSERPWKGLEPRLAALTRDRFAVPVRHLAFAPLRARN